MGGEEKLNMLTQVRWPRTITKVIALSLSLSKTASYGTPSHVQMSVPTLRSIDLP